MPTRKTKKTPSTQTRARESSRRVGAANSPETPARGNGAAARRRREGAGRGVDIDKEFEPHYVVPREKAEVVRRIREAAGKASVVYLATDPDREGEAISWHLVAAADLEADHREIRRVVFHQLTPGAVRG